ncbi:MAG: hypothetical protein HC932_00160 [Thermales bacterium]|nr:hypothetical protein [Thermales bacterium]
MKSNELGQTIYYGSDGGDRFITNNHNLAYIVNDFDDPGDIIVLNAFSLVQDRYWLNIITEPSGLGTICHVYINIGSTYVNVEGTRACEFYNTPNPLSLESGLITTSE